MISALSAPVPEKRNSDFTDRVVRVRTFERAAEMLGQDRLAAGLGISGRMVRMQLDGTRGLSDAYLAGAAAELERAAAEMIAQAGRLRRLSRGSNGR
jgi:hypothetical protein